MPENSEQGKAQVIEDNQVTDVKDEEEQGLEEDVEKEEDQVQDVCPKDSINGNETRNFLPRATINRILCKRLQFSHIGDSFNQPPAVVEASEDKVERAKATGDPQSDLQQQATYHSLF